MHGSNAARFKESFWVIIDRVKIPNRTNPKANIFKLVHDWLRDKRKGKWVLILNNVDNADLLLTPQTTSQATQEGGLSSSSAQPLFLYLPLSATGLILITTQSRDVALRIVEEGNIITVEPMDKGQALALCKKKLGIQSNKSAIAELATVLKFMPLAIVQAAAYVKE